MICTAVRTPQKAPRAASTSNPFISEDAEESLQPLLAADQTSPLDLLTPFIKAQAQLKQLMELVLTDLQGVFPAFTLPSTHPLSAMLAVESIIPTVRGAPSLLLYGLQDTHALPPQQLKPALLQLVNQTTFYPIPINVLVGASGIGSRNQNLTALCMRSAVSTTGSDSSRPHCVAYAGCVQERRGHCLRRSAGDSACSSRLHSRLDLKNLSGSRAVSI